ncbi:hypothetical protein [Sulfuriroseicoccus oceanibius]|uniref:Uncharacterized protein n=1 Tax=Sulfuriroseicoccus oceanibius TaxID=2707525 RepID=A0A6B3L3T3_9BACT|nr:hypothetical protein [Sulfuriroseicoccus oceanibius]QQL44628.1 hypothetical protein G3M56_012155 [Sulfuriroseicoccus oceanibius]
MSLRQFHLCFIIFVALCAFLYAAFVFSGGYGPDAAEWMTASGWIGAIAGGLLVAYGIVFALKMRRFAD